MARLPRPSPEDLNSLFEPGKINRTHKAFQERFRSRYRLGQLAAVIPGLSEEELKVWRSHLDEDLPRSINVAVRAVVAHALAAGKKPTPIRFTYKPARKFEMTISESAGEKGETEIFIVIKGPVPREVAKARRARYAK